LRIRFFCGHPYLIVMPTAFEFCLPTAAKIVPDGAGWLHEIKYDGYRLRVERKGDTVRLFTRNGHDWTKRCPWIVEAALKKPRAALRRAVVQGFLVHSRFHKIAALGIRPEQRR
jgi:ATP-dependent DNA ligase